MEYHCPLCGRDVPVLSDHHLTPRSRGGTETLPICQDCHRSIHSFFTNKELEQTYHSVNSLLDNERFAKHMAWLGKQDSSRRYRTKRNRDNRKRGRSG